MNISEMFKYWSEDYDSLNMLDTVVHPAEISNMNGEELLDFFYRCMAHPLLAVIVCILPLVIIAMIMLIFSTLSNIKFKKFTYNVNSDGSLSIYVYEKNGDGSLGGQYIEKRYIQNEYGKWKEVSLGTSFFDKNSKMIYIGIFLFIILRFAASLVSLYKEYGDFTIWFYSTLLAMIVLIVYTVFCFLFGRIVGNIRMNYYLHKIDM